ncbi:hypothetical protein LINGRAHAP2_LOCUS12725 [Linum grandiflorum]
MHSNAQNGKYPVPWKNTVGIPNPSAASTAHEKFRSATRQSGRVKPISSPIGPWRSSRARKNLTTKSGPNFSAAPEEIKSADSDSSGSPTSSAGKRISPTSMTSVLIWLETKSALRGVVTTVHLTPWAAKSLAMSIIGIMWP